MHLAHTTRGAPLGVPARSMGAALGELAFDESPHEAGNRNYFLMFWIRVAETLPAKPVVPAYDAVI